MLVTKNNKKYAILAFFAKMSGLRNIGTLLLLRVVIGGTRVEDKIHENVNRMDSTS
jgi:hypothetical protein